MSLRNIKTSPEKQPRIWRPETGFTLLEVMVAVAIIGMSFVSLLASQSQSISIASIARFETVAAMLARHKLAEIQVDGFDELSGGSGEFEDDFSEYHWQSEVTELTEDETGIAGSDGLLKRVDLQVSRGDDEDAVFSVRTLIMAKIEPAEEK
jgi:general secretion pathway protein I